MSVVDVAPRCSWNRHGWIPRLWPCILLNECELYYVLYALNLPKSLPWMTTLILSNIAVCIYVHRSRNTWTIQIDNRRHRKPHACIPHHTHQDNKLSPSLANTLIITSLPAKNIYIYICRQVMVLPQHHQPTASVKSFGIWRPQHSTSLILCRKPSSPPSPPLGRDEGAQAHKTQKRRGRTSSSSETCRTGKLTLWGEKL